MKVSKKKSDFEVKRSLGTGSFGEVKLVQEKETGQHYAMKIIAKDKIIRDSMVVKLFKNEVRILRTINHPNIIRCFHKFEDSTHYYLILNYCNQGDMEQLAKKGAVSELKALMYLKQLCSGFQVLHEHKIMHRDFKPANVFLHDDIAVIGDFGLAQVDVEFATSHVGTPVFVAPEVTSGQSKGYSNLADLWSLGLTMYFLLLGGLPWKVSSREMLAHKRLSETGKNLPFPTNSSLSEEWKLLLQQMIEPDPSKRITWKALINHPLLQKLHSQSDIACSSTAVLKMTDELFGIAKLKIDQTNGSVGRSERDEFFELFQSIKSEVKTNNPLSGQNEQDYEYDDDWGELDRVERALQSQATQSSSLSILASE